MSSNSKLREGDADGPDGLEPQGGGSEAAHQEGIFHRNSPVPKVDTIEVFLDKLERDEDIVAVKNMPATIIAPPIRFLSAVIDANLRGDGIRQLLDNTGQVDREKLLAKLKTIFGTVVVTIQNVQYAHFFVEYKSKETVIQKYQTAFAFIAAAHGIQEQFNDFLGMLGVVPDLDAAKSQLGQPGRKRLSTKPYMGPSDAAGDEAKPSSRSNVPVRTEEISAFEKRGRMTTIPGLQLEDLLLAEMQARSEAGLPKVVQETLIAGKEDGVIDAEIELAVASLVRSSILPPAMKDEEGKSLGHIDSDTEALRMGATYEFHQAFSDEFLALFPLPDNGKIKSYDGLIKTALYKTIKKITHDSAAFPHCKRYFMNSDLIAKKAQKPLFRRLALSLIEERAGENLDGKLKKILGKMEGGEGIAKMLISIDFNRFSAGLKEAAGTSDKNIISYILSCGTNELDEVVAHLTHEVVAGFSESILRKYPGSPFSWLIYFYQDDKPELKTRIYELFYDAIYNYCTGLRYGYEDVPEEVAQVAEGARINMDEIMGALELPPSSVAPPSLEEFYRLPEGYADENTDDDVAATLEAMLGDDGPVVIDMQTNPQEVRSVPADLSEPVVEIPTEQAMVANVDSSVEVSEGELDLSDDDRDAIAAILGREYDEDEEKTAVMDALAQEDDAGSDATVEFRETGEMVGPIIAKIPSPAPQAPSPKEKVIIAEDHGAIILKHPGKGLEMPELTETQEYDLKMEGEIKIGKWLVEFDDLSNKPIYTYMPTGQVFFPVRPAAGRSPSSPPPAITETGSRVAMPATRREPIRPLADTIPDSPPLSHTLPLVTPQKEMEVPLVRYGHGKLPEPTPPPVRVMKGTQVIDAPPPSTLRAGPKLEEIQKVGSSYHRVPVYEVNPQGHIIEVAADRPTKPEIVLKAPVADTEYLRSKSNPPARKSRWGLIAGVAFGALSTIGGVAAYQYFQSNKADTVEVDAKQKADNDSKIAAAAKAAETAKPADTIKPAQPVNPVETKKPAVNEAAPKVEAVLGSNSYELGSAHGTNTFTGKAEMFEGSVDATPFASKLRTTEWIEDNQKAAASMLKIYDIAKDHFDSGTSALIVKNEKILRDMSALTDFTPANFRKTFESKYSQAELNAGLNLLLAYERIENLTGNDPSKLEGTLATIKLTMGVKSHDVTARFAKAIDFKTPDAVPTTPAPAPDNSPGVDQKKDDGKTGFNNIHNDGPQIEYGSVDVDLSEFDEVHASTASNINDELAEIDKGWDDVPDPVVKVEVMKKPTIDDRIAWVKAGRRDALLTRGEVFIPPLSDDMDGSVMLAIKNGFLKECTTASQQNKVEAIFSKLSLRDMVEYEAMEHGTFGRLSENKLAELNAAAMLEEANPEVAKTKQDLLLEEIEAAGWDFEPTSVAQVSAVTKSRIISIGGSLNKAA